MTHFNPTIVSVVLLLLLSSAQSFVFVKSTASNYTEKRSNSQMSSFGPMIGPNGIRGYFAQTNPIDACLKVQTAVNKSHIPRGYPQLPMFALVKRGNCSFVTKVRNAQAANYSAVLVYDNVRTDDLFSMGRSQYENVNDIWIPSVFISSYDGADLIKLESGEDFKYFIVVTSDTLLPFLYYLGPFFILVTVAMLAMGGGFLMKVVFDWHRQRRCRLSRRHLKQLMEKKFVKGEDPYETCVICLEDYMDGDKIRILPCSHAFHSTRCIDPWLLKNKRSCPICKRHIRIPNLPSELQDEEDEENEIHNLGGDIERQPIILPRDDRNQYGSTVEPSSSDGAAVSRASGLVIRLAHAISKMRSRFGSHHLHGTESNPLQPNVNQTHNSDSSDAQMLRSIDGDSVDFSSYEVTVANHRSPDEGDEHSPQTASNHSQDPTSSLKA